MMLYPTLRASELVGTDLVQAVPLVASAAFGHILFGDFKVGLTASLLAGCIPGTYIGARLSATLNGAIIRRALAFVLLASALKLLGVSSAATAEILLALALLAGPVWMVVRRRHGFPAIPLNEKRASTASPWEHAEGAARLPAQMERSAGHDGPAVRT